MIYKYINLFTKLFIYIIYVSLVSSCYQRYVYIYIYIYIYLSSKLILFYMHLRIFIQTLIHILVEWIYLFFMF
jgi:hypothetical protein